MSESFIASGAPGEIEWRGKPLKISAVSLKLERVFGAALERRTVEGLERNRDAFSEDGYQEAIRQFNRDLAAGAYEWSGPICRAARATADGTKLLAWLCITDIQPNFPPQHMEALFRDKGKWDELVRVIRRLQTPPPNGQPPAAEAAGGASDSPTSTPDSSTQA